MSTEAHDIVTQGTKGTNLSLETAPHSNNKRIVSKFQNITLSKDLTDLHRCKKPTKKKLTLRICNLVRVCNCPENDLMREIYETEHTQIANLSFITHSFIIVSSCSKSISEMALM